MIIRCMSKKARRNAGLGDPPSAFYTNVPESANAVIKRAVKFKENEISDFVQEMSILIGQQREDVDSAVTNTGPYQLAEEFRDHLVLESVWFRKTVEERGRILKKFHAKPMSPVQTTTSPEVSSLVETKSLTSSANLSVTLTDITSVPQRVLLGIQQKAISLLTREGAIVEAPGNTTNPAFMIASQTSARPHFVQIAKSGKATCDAECLMFKTAKLCSHTVAGAEKSAVLNKFVSWFVKNGPKAINLTSLVTFDSAQGTGKKSRQAATARRKGGRSSKQPTVTTVIDRPLNVNGTSVNVLTPASQDEQQVHALPQQLLQQTPLSVPRQVQLPTPQHILTPTPGQMPPILPQPFLPSPPSFTPAPADGVFELHLLQYCPPLVRVCFGCSQTLKPGNRISPPPYDMTIVSRMSRPYPHPWTGETAIREGNVYFHVSANCVRNKEPCFVPNLLVVPTWVGPLLTYENMMFLRQFGVQS